MRGHFRGQLVPECRLEAQHFYDGGELAGMVGFEPTVHCTKNSCLTTWLHPNCGGI